MDLFDSFMALAAASSAVDLSAVPLPGRASDYLGKSSDGGPVFLLRDASLPSYSPPSSSSTSRSSFTARAA